MNMESINFAFPIDMVKKEQRIVSGIATADNIDKVGDLVDFRASLEAFSKWEGNIREMHAPVAVGRAIKYEPVQIQGDDGERYNAIKVDVYISKGAEDTWQKVLDGTLRAFSIGGRVLEKMQDEQKMYRGKPVSVITKYELGELSLVDNPANAVAVVDVIKRMGDCELDYILKIACSDINLTIPSSVQKAAQVGLRQRAEFGRGGTSVGLASARRLARGGTVSPEFVRKVARYFPRHEVDLRAEGADPGEDGYPSNGRIAWNLWGGTPGWRWAASKVEQLNNCTSKSFNDFEIEENNKCSCGCSDSFDDIIESLHDETESLKTEEINKEVLNMEDSLQNENIYGKVSDVETSAEAKLSLLKRFVNWIAVDEEGSAVEKSATSAVLETADADAEADIENMEDDMDIELLKQALGSIIDEKLTEFSASIKSEVDAAVSEKIDEVSKSVNAQRDEIEAKIAAAQFALDEQAGQVQALAEAGAVKKSVDPEDEEEVVIKSEPKSFWENVYLPQALIKTLGYDS
jgi:hypothetical protein